MEVLKCPFNSIIIRTDVARRPGDLVVKMHIMYFDRNVIGLILAGSFDACYASK